MSIVGSGSDQMDSAYLWEQREDAFLLHAECRSKERREAAAVLAVFSPGESRKLLGAVLNPQKEIKQEVP